MTQAKISADNWQQGEFFYYTFVPILMITALVLVILFLIFLTNRDNRFSKGVMLVSGSLILFLGGAFLVGNHLYQDYQVLDSGILPNIRDRKKNFIGYDYYSRDTLNSFKRVNEDQGIKKLGIYEPKKVTEKIEYLGQNFGSVYFKIGAQQYYLRKEPVIKDVKEAQLEGKQYILQDHEYRKLGFFQRTNFFLEAVVIPKSQRELRYEQEGTQRSQEFGKNQKNWAVGAED